MQAETITDRGRTWPKGYSMPAEWEPPQATWLAWLHHATDWPSKLSTIRWVYTEIIRRLAVGERVSLLVRSGRERDRVERQLRRAGAAVGQVDFMVCETNRSWMRDTGPLFVRQSKGGSELAIIDFHFNAWAKYPDFAQDRQIASLAARYLGTELYSAHSKGRDFVLEGGSIEVNGAGTVITTEECLLDQVTQVRNPGWERSEIEIALCRWLGVEQVIWLNQGIAGDDTHGHVDDLCRFVNPSTVVLAQEANGADVNHRVLAENRERLEGVRLGDGSRLEMVMLPMPAPVHFDGYRLPASYGNFYISNAAVLVPTFNDPNDREALGRLAELFPDRPVVGIHALDLVLGFGTLHCLSQQQPVGST